MGKFIFYIASFMLAVTVLCGCKERKTSVKLSGTLLKVSDSIINNCVADTFRLGNIKHGETVIKEFAVYNADNKPFIISDIDADCGCLASDFDKKPIKPGETSGVSVSFASSGYYGYILKRIKFITTASANPMIVYIEAEVQ